MKYGENEYDPATQSFLKNGEFQKGICFLKTMMIPLLKGNPYLEKAVLTGILSSAKSSMLSGLNNLKHFNLTDENFTGYYGFN